ncbi:MAG: RagB/SusD family nutrient uptake outer membrane protein [Chitinophagaceae bacterium]|nr:RagB/SusD family nutrient uptake outer membrane protein [Chitinophagaceae bacterium]
MSKYFNKSIIQTTVAVAASVVLLGSCKKFLDQQPITDVGSAVVFSDVASTTKALAGVYSRLVGDAGYGIRLSLYYPVDNDEMQGPGGTSDNDRRDIARYSATSSNAQLNNPFNQIFQGIEYANICIDQIPKMSMYSGGTDQQKKQLQRMYGEALTLRAQFYLEAIRNWGDLPAHFQPGYVQASENQFPVRASRDTLYNQLLADLKVASAMVPWRDELTAIGDAVDERISKGAVKGLRARIALYRGGYALRSNGTMQRASDYLTYYQIAKDECNEIITSGKHALNPSFKSLWKDNVGSKIASDALGELMFQASAIGSTAAEDTKLGYYNGPSVTSGTTAFGNKSINVVPTYFYLFDSTDTRRDVTCAPYNLVANTPDGSNLIKTGQALTGMCDGKYRRDWATPIIPVASYGTQYLSLKWQILRYSDVLLMFAEAENELNGPAAAYNAINQVRRRGFGKPIGSVDAFVDLPIGLSKSDFLKAIVRERSLELGGEGIRKYDLIRWNLLNTAINETKTNLTNMALSSGTATYTYMLGAPAYAANFATLPVSMYYKTNSMADDATLWSNSFYKLAPTSTPAGTSKVTWVGVAVNTTALARFATGFATGKGELLPIPQPARDANKNLTQNPNY